MLRCGAYAYCLCAGWMLGLNYLGMPRLSRRKDNKAYCHQNYVRKNNIMKKKTLFLQSWANATTIATIWHRFQANKLSRNVFLTDVIF